MNGIRLAIIAILACVFTSGSSGPANVSSVRAATGAGWETYFEKSGGLRTPRYDQTISYCLKLAGGSPWIKYTTFGKSPQGRDLPLLIADRDELFSPEKAHAGGKAILLIQACIHAGESDGKDAGLMLIRDLAIRKKYPEIWNNVTILFIPIFNVDGHERFGPYNRINQNGPEDMGWRVTAQNLNLNRDYLKADTPEMKAWIRMFVGWLPDFFVDCHVTDGADYQYTVTCGLEIRGNMDADLTTWTRQDYLQSLEKMMAEAGLPISPYVFFRNRHDPASGLVSWVAPPRFSQGYTAVQNRPGILIETHMLKSYGKRVTGTYEMLKKTIQILNRDHDKLRDLTAQADARAASGRLREDRFPLRFRPAPDSLMIDFLGVEYKKTKSDLSGGYWIKWSSKPKTYRIPFFYKWVPSVTVELPAAYIVPPEWTGVIERLELHGLKCRRLKQDETLKIGTYKFKEVKWRSKPYEGRFPLSYEVEAIEETREYPAGSVVVDMNQRAARVAAHLLEPQAPDALVYWGFFDTIFEQKEYAEDYVMEKMAREMLSSDPELRREFEEKKAGDDAFASNPREILNWFYMRTPYWDKRISVYPVGRIMDGEALERLDLDQANK